MTCYYKILEERITNKLRSHDITTFSNKLNNNYAPRISDPNTLWVNKQEQRTGDTILHPQKNNPYAQRERDRLETHSQPTCIKATSEAIFDCANNPNPIDALTTGVVAKVPIVLAKLTVQLNIDSVIDLHQWVSEIKNIKKHLKIIQCLLLQNTSILFIKGLVKKNIEYAAASGNKANGLCGDIRYCTVDIPFKCTTKVNFNGYEPLSVIPDSSKEFEYYQRQNIPESGFSYKEELPADNITELNQISTAFYNELPFCELTSSRIVEFDELLAQEKMVRSIEEKMVIYLTLKILQYRQVEIPPA